MAKKTIKKEEADDFINLGIVLNSKNEVLMVRRKKKETGRDNSVLEWAFPGGRQRFDETREECVKRNVLNETGYDIEPIKQIALRIEHPQFPIMVAYHLCELNSQKQVAKPREPHEIAEIKWVKPEEIKDLVSTKIDPDVAKELGIETEKE